MYGEQTAKTESYPSDEPVFSNIQNRLAKGNEQYSSLINQIEDKLHSILNLRSPDKAAGVSTEKSINDFVGSIGNQLEFIENNNVRLHRILEHIQKLVG